MLCFIKLITCNKIMKSFYANILCFYIYENQNRLLIKSLLIHVMQYSHYIFFKLFLHTNSSLNSCLYKVVVYNILNKMIINFVLQLYIN